MAWDTPICSTRTVLVLHLFMAVRCFLNFSHLHARPLSPRPLRYERPVLATRAVRNTIHGERPLVNMSTVNLANEELRLAEQAWQRWYAADLGLPSQIRRVAQTDLDKIRRAQPRFTNVAAHVFSDLGSKSQAEAAVKRGELLLNGKLAESSRVIRTGDMISFTKTRPRKSSKKEFDVALRCFLNLCSIGLRTVFEDEYMAVVFKPPGVHTKRRNNPRYVAFEEVLPLLLTPPKAALGDTLQMPIAMHRLDVPVSGLVLVSKTRLAALRLEEQIQGRRLNKSYIALVVGVPPSREQLIDSPVQGKPARTRLKVLDVVPHLQWGNLTRVRLHPETGRMHQLRIHLASLGCPIVGDDLYWDMAATVREGESAPPLPPVRQKGGLFLQACALRFEHPANADEIIVVVPEANKFKRLIQRAERAMAYVDAHAHDGAEVHQHHGEAGAEGNTDIRAASRVPWIP